MPRKPAPRRDFGYIRRLPLGRYQASFVGPDLVRHNAPVTFENRDLAVIWLAGGRRSLTRPSPTAPAGSRPPR